MDQRLDTYAESKVVCDPGDIVLSDTGLFIDVSCDFQCKDLVPRVERVRGTFLPKNLGLTPGNGSNNTNTMWSTLTVSLKIWSQKICLEKAVLGCKSAQNLESFGIKELESGKWKMSKFPGCHEKTISVSPFDNSVASIRVNELTSLIETPKVESKNVAFDYPGLTISLAQGVQIEGCKKVIKADMCFGDCIDLAKTTGDYVETLGTPDPLGTDHMEICGDDLDAKLKNLKLSSSVRRELCESYFWQSYMKQESRYRSCAAIRGETDCDKF